MIEQRQKIAAIFCTHMVDDFSTPGHKYDFPSTIFVDWVTCTSIVINQYKTVVIGIFVLVHVAHGNTQVP